MNQLATAFMKKKKKKGGGGEKGAKILNITITEK